MKRSIFYVAAMAALASCSEADVAVVTPEVAPETETKQMTISVALPDTRVAVDEDWKCSWEEGDVLWACKDGDITDSPIMFSIDGSPSGGSATFTGTVPTFEYGFIYTGSSDASSLSNIDLTAQREGADKPYLQSEDSFAANTTPESVKIGHLCTYIDLEMAFGEDAPNGATIESVVCSGLNGEEKAKHPITITDGVTTVADGVARIQFSAFSTALAIGDALTISATLKKGGVYSLWSATITAGVAFEFVEGQYHEVGCDMVQVTDLWTAHASTAEFTGGDSVDNPIEISTAEQFAKLAKDLSDLAKVDVDDEVINPYEGKFFKLTADIDLSAHEWDPIGLNYNHSIFFSGTFDGDGHTISGLYINQPDDFAQAIFGQIQDATIKNLSVRGSVVAENDCGGVVGRAYGSSNVTNCHNSCSVSGSNAAGGVVGVAESNVTITDCSNSGAVTGLPSEWFTDPSSGGVVGYTKGSVANCHNSGAVVNLCSGLSGGITTVGGVVGFAEGSVDKCYNSGDVKNSGDNTTIYTSGVVGKSNGNVTNCYNSGDVDNSGSGGLVTASGVVGLPNGSDIANSYNSGAVTNSGAGSSHIIVGGVVAFPSNGKKIDNCYNSGAVKNSGTTPNLFVGSVAGFAFGATISNCYYLTGTASQGIGGANDIWGVTDSMLADFMTDGSLRNNLNNQRESGYCKWVDGADGSPTLDFEE